MKFYLNINMCQGKKEYFNSIIFIFIYGKENQKGWSHWQVRNPLRWSHQKNRQEVRTPTASQICLPSLRQGNSPIIQQRIRRVAAGIWHCKGCKTTFAGGAYEFATSVATTAKVTMNRLKKIKEELANPVKEEEKKDKKKDKK